ncbi:amidohydrolase/deacetylase family metallohydrolase [Periweissella fabalis]|uniref:Amidohydrolase/deacetylase family metallohydrolase n=1 Tax=Periweissella fabalis TaxID=1070421 RepID=A0A7X6N1M5_9LACO|nr:amidohydrolase/deacetylase family metallohydrolase [Periweissella fabalis]MCM0599166.1 amidohydrolase/deacetylase family metallohydrolase [Periweissella fabalis]NKZ23445.1 amidohydrolase/deacetylase family metallohydrolase [Periweissella fabalis]
MTETVLKGGRLITGEPFEVAYENGKLTAVGTEINPVNKTVIDITGQYLSPGWIDDHVHCFSEMHLYYDYPDEIGVQKGVTTVIDAGTTGAENIGRFHQLALQAKTNVLALVNISKWGIVEQDELADLSKIKQALVTKVLHEYPDFIVGIKARMSKTVIGSNGITPLKLAKEIQKTNQNLPLMVHIGSEPPKLTEILDVMEPGDVMTHCFNGKPNGILDRETDEIKAFAKVAYEHGIIFDTGHGTDSFNFHVAEVAFAKGIKANSISTDIYIRNRKNGPVYDLATTMEKLHVVGYTWPEIIEKVTTAPANNFHLTTKGKLVVGADADITVFDFEDGAKTLTDSNGFTRTTNVQIKPHYAIIGGACYDVL